MKFNTNQKLANIFYEIAYFLEMEGVPFKPYAYEKAAIILENLEKDVGDIYQEKGIEGLEAIPGIGKSIAQKIEEYLKAGKIKYYEEFKKRYPVDIEELTSVEGAGPKMVKVLYEELGITNLKELEKAAREGKIRNLPGFGEKTEKNILQGIAFLKKRGEKFLLAEALPLVEEIEKRLKKVKGVKKLSVAGSLRRKKETIGDVDILVVAEDPEKVMNEFMKLPGVIKVWGRGKTKSSIRLDKGIDVDLRVIDEKFFGSALQYFTGSKEHNIALRKIAIDLNFKLNEYGIFRGKKFVAGRDEKEVYQILKMEWIPPELRENRGEIELAQKKKLPKLIELKDIKGDLHCHTKWNGGANSIEEMANTAINLGYQYLGISDHTKFLKIEHGLDEKKLAEQRKEIDELNYKLKTINYKLKILQGAETNILKDGRIDIKDEALKKLDYAIAGIHSHFKMSKEEMTERIIKAMKNPYINIISHPTGRILKRRDGYQIDFEKILRVAKETDTALEINSYPERLDLNDIHIKLAKEAGVKLIINSDAHHKDQLRYMEYGVYQARRGWAEKKDILNCWPLEKMLEFFNRKSKRPHL
ncbi:MAG: DNA polymerase/3'-5' exonuclease PolX [Candidatus Pacebacteria bacterium]|nr:DNA polymerase/3'-5' exonuclease PolX [Candidatus Paceibacterota bacterium]